MQLKLGQIVDILNARVVGSFGDSEIVSGFAIDSRRVLTDEIFVALPGESVDGHNYVSAAAKNGAIAVLVSREVVSDIPQIIVEDTGAALIALAKFIRNNFAGTVIAVTGSCGKTTTRDIIATLLSMKYVVHKPQGNFNTEIGLPLTILATPENADILLLELGVSYPGDMQVLASIARPDCAVFTNVGATHTEFLGDRRGVADEKAVLIDYVQDGGTVILNADDPLVSAMADRAGDRNIVTYGIDNKADVYAGNIVELGVDGYRFDLNGEHNCHLPLPGRHNLSNALAATAVAIFAQVPIDDIKTAYRDIAVGNMRSQIVEKDSINYIIDCYNSSPKAARAALDMLVSLSGDGRSVVVLGEMRELGDISQKEHLRLGRYASEIGVDVLVGLGEGGAMITDGSRVTDGGTTTHNFVDTKSLTEFLKEELKSGDTVLFKASRGVRMERVPQALGIMQ